jgi:hypothetical protein
LPYCILQPLETSASTFPPIQKEWRQHRLRVARHGPSVTLHANLGLAWGERAETGVNFLQAFASSSDQHPAFMIGRPPGQNEEAALASSLMQEKHAGHSVSGSVRQNEIIPSSDRLH